MKKTIFSALVGGQVTIDGKKYYKKFDGDLPKAEAREQLLEWRKEKKKIKFNDYKTWEYCKEKFFEYIKKELNIRTYKKYKYCFSNIEKSLKMKLMQDLDLPKIINFRDKLEKIAEGVDNHGSNHLVSCLRVFLKFCMSRGYMPAYTLEHIIKLKTKPIQNKTYTDNEIKLMLKYSPQHWKIAILLGYDCSHRPEEMTNQLRCNIDIDTEIGVIADLKRI